MVKTEDNRDVMLNIAGKDITLDLNEKIITVNYDDSTLLYTVVCVEDGAGLTVKNGTIDLTIGETKAGDYKCAAYMFWKRGTTGHLTIENGTFQANDLEDSMVYTNGNEIVTVKGGTFTLDQLDDETSPWIFNVQGQGDKHVIVTGGTFNADINRQKWSSEVLVPETYYTTDNGDGTWTVKEGAVAYVSTGMLTGPYYVRKNIGYATFVEAIEAALKYIDSPITLLADYEGDYKVEKLPEYEHEGELVTMTLTVNKNRFYADGLTAAAGIKKTEDNTKITFEAVAFVAQNTTTNVSYGSVSEALAAAKSGETVKMITDSLEGTIIVPVGVTLDLNGQTLTADYVVAFKDSHVVDNSADNDGLLKAAKDQVALDVNNEQLPAWNENGYQFFEISMKTQLVEDEVNDSAELKFYIEKTGDWRKLLALFADGATDNDLSVMVKLTWVANDGKNPTTQYYSYNEATIINAAQQINGGWGIYNCTQTHVSVRGAVQFYAVIMSGTNVELAVQGE